MDKRQLLHPNSPGKKVHIALMRDGQHIGVLHVLVGDKIDSKFAVNLYVEHGFLVFAVDKDSAVELGEIT